MLISAGTKYAILFMMSLAASHDKQGYAPIRGIAEKEAIPLKFLEHVVALLKSKGLIQSQRGTKGGYRLSRSPDAISLIEIHEATQGPVDSSGSAFSMSDSPGLAVISSISHQINDRITDYLSSQTLAHMSQAVMEKNLSPMFYI